MIYILAAEALGRGDAELREIALEPVHARILARAAGGARLEQLARDKRHVRLLQAPLAEHIGIGLVDRLLPGLIGAVGFALVENDALDDAHFHSLLAQRDNSRIVVAARFIVCRPGLKPARRSAQVALPLILVEKLDGSSAHGHR